MVLTGSNAEAAARSAPEEPEERVSAASVTAHQKPSLRRNAAKAMQALFTFCCALDGIQDGIQ